MIADTDIPFTCKYASFDKVLDSAGEKLRNLLLSCPISGRDNESISVDIKVQDLIPGKYTCIPGWHSDTLKDPDPIHHLFVIGENRTEFLEEDGSISVIPNATWKSYGHQKHRGPKVKVPETRILIRITESTTLKPSYELVFRKH